MVITRSGTSVRRHSVRFKSGPDVRRVLEYDEDDWGWTDDSDSDHTREYSSPSGARVGNGGILVNGTSHNAQYSNNDYYIESPVLEEQGQNSCDTTISYDIAERKTSSWLWDAMLFTLVTLSCYKTVLFLYTLWGYGLYLAIATLCIIIFSYNIAYFDSTKPGIVPPSPVSPAIYREMSGHTYHLTYLMSIMNGLVFLAVEPYVSGIIVPPV